MALGLKDVILCDRKGAIYKGRPDLDPVRDAAKVEMAAISNLEMKKGSLEDVITKALTSLSASPGLGS